MTAIRKGPNHFDGIKKLQVGCGPTAILPDWWNVDIRVFPGIDEALDVTASWPWFNQLTHVYGEHFLEHITVDGALKFLLEAHKSLLVGGKIRLSTPGLEWVLKTHFSTANDVSDDKRLEETLTINRAFHGWGHQFLYSRPMLQSILEATGFEDVKFFSYGESQEPAFTNLEQHGGYSLAKGYPSVWIVEGTKGLRDAGKLECFAAKIHQQFLRHVFGGH